MRRQIRIGKSSSFADVARLCIFERRAHTMPYQHIDRWLRVTVCSLAAEIELSQRAFFGEGRLQILSSATGGNCACYECHPYRFELLGRQSGSSQAGPK